MLNIGIMALTFFYLENTKPYVVKGLIDGKMGMVISQDPTKASSVTILRSNNENKVGDDVERVAIHKDPCFVVVPIPAYI
jgi:hypothetical protein